MLLVMIGTTIVLLVATHCFWRAVTERETRWKLFALRDELRQAAIRNPKLLETRSFWTIDRALTREARHLPSFSLWVVLPIAVALESSGPSADFEAVRSELRDPEYAELAKIFDTSSNLILGHFGRRHLFLTLVGGLFVSMKVIGEYVSAGMVRPPGTGGKSTALSSAG